MFRLVRMTLRERKAALVAAFVALFGASALITAFGILLQSGLTGTEPVRRYAGAAVVVSGRQTFSVHEGKRTKSKPLAEPAPLDRTLPTEIARVPGVRKAVGDVAFPARVVDPAGRQEWPSTGHGWESSALGPFDLVAGRAPQHPGEVVLDAGLARRSGARPGQAVRLATTEAAAVYRVTGLATPRNGPPRSAPVFFQDTDAARLSGDPGRVRAVGVLATPGTDPDELAGRLEHRLAGAKAVARTGADRGRAEHPEAAAARGELRELAGSLGATVVLITMIVVAGTLALGLHQRRRELALLRAVAATPRQLHKLVAAEALLVSLAAATLGCLPGILLARLLRTALTAVGRLPEDFTLSYGPIPPLVALAAVVLTAEAAALGVARRAVAIRPVEALGEAAVEQPRLGPARRTLGIVLFLLGIAASLLPLLFRSVFAVAGAASGGLVMVLAVLLLGPPIVSLATRMVARPLRRSTGPHGRLAVAELRANARRLAAGIAPLALAVGFAMVQLGIPTTTAAAAGEQARHGILADFTLTGGAGLPVTAARDAARIPHVAAATGVTRAELFASRKLLGSPEIFKYQAQGVTSDGLDRTLDLKVTKGTLARLREGTVAISATAAGTLGAGIGDPVRLHLPDGTESRPAVVAVYERGLGFGDITLPQQVLLAHGGRHLTDAVFVKAAPGADRKTLRPALGALAGPYPGLRVLNAAGLSAAQQEQAFAGVLTSALPLVLVFGYLAIAVANTLVMATLGRAREFALLRLIGASARQVLRMLRVEAGIVVAVAVLIGSLVPLLPLVTVSLGLTGSPVPYVPPLLYLGIVAAAALIGAPAILLPARWALRLPVTGAAGPRE